MPKKKFGQNFLNNEGLCDQIIQLEKIENNNILEIGAGNLALTKKIVLKNPKKFVSLEIDIDLIKKYENTSFSKYLYHANALKIDEMIFFRDEKFTIISNLPFNLSSELLIKWIKFQNTNNRIKSMTLMFQKELAERIIAEKNTKKFGRISILAGAYFSIKKKIDIKKNNFFPMPQVDATVLQFTPLKKNRISKNNLNKLEKITSLFFNDRRKKNQKKIKKIFTEEQIKKEGFDIFFDLRPENLDRETYYKFTEKL
ncbi:MAG: 16S rRNA (adenine(1518)-N(6)/adenine(1519)-N(6))-dimethyltransferase RsmA [Pelagibacteraceae bacterium]|nr:16S rRNA (adenine(1518)-N(6)/adenine(1519)-N(6))-dimethyltransferase RsmA [Pelagibacteraceae bacterium]MCI5079022.1 16S rRNA (adenine(1518)-N(6)/adenine(1519)-N(6))-dimethyltransferase RsmA [Pelagibacteraceae bacterium]